MMSSCKHKQAVVQYKNIKSIWDELGTKPGANMYALGDSNEETERADKLTSPKKATHQEKDHG